MKMQADDSSETLDAVLGSLSRGDIAPCYLIYGEDDYRVGDALGRIVEGIMPPPDRDLNLFLMDGEQEDVNRLCESLLTLPLDPGRKIVAVKNTRLFHSRAALPDLVRKIRESLDADPDRAASCFMQFLNITGWKLDELKDGGWRRITDEEWRAAVAGDGGDDREEWLPRAVDAASAVGADEREAKGDAGGTDRLCEILTTGLPPGNHLILTATAADKRKRLFKVISEEGKVLHFPFLKGESRQKQVLMSQAAGLLSRAGKRMSPSAWLVLGNKTAFNLRESLAAIEKLVSYTGDRETIEDADVEAVVTKTREEKVFDLTAVIAERKLNPALAVLTHLLEQGVHPLLILSMLTREIRNLLYAKLFILSGKLGRRTRKNIKADMERIVNIIQIVIS